MSKILLTGATGYIGKRLLPVLLEAGHDVICCVRNRHRFKVPKGYADRVEVFEVDFLEDTDYSAAPKNFDVAYYLIHSMSASIDKFAEMEQQAAENFVHYLDQTEAQQVIYLTGIIPQTDELSEHLESRLRVARILDNGRVPLTALRAGIIVGSGSASFEIIRDLVEKLPVMIAPKWLNSKCQPIAIRNVLQFLTGVLLLPETYHRNFDIGCGEVLTYRQMLLQYAKVRGLQRWIFTVPVMSPRLSSYWLYFITSTTYNLAVNLVDSMKMDVVCRNGELGDLLQIELFSYQEAVRMAFQKIKQNSVVSSWKDALVVSTPRPSILEAIEVPEYGCFIDHKCREINPEERQRVLHNIWSIGGERGWYFGNWLWKLRGYLDKIFGGIGLRRGRTHPFKIRPGDALDFWRVIVADEQAGRLLLYAEMLLPGDAWLEFRMEEHEDTAKLELHQTATYRPEGILGRLYWYAVLPFHYFIFNGMINNIISYRDADYTPPTTPRSVAKAPEQEVTSI